MSPIVVLIWPHRHVWYWCLFTDKLTEIFEKWEFFASDFVECRSVNGNCMRKKNCCANINTLTQRREVLFVCDVKFNSRKKPVSMLWMLISRAIDAWRLIIGLFVWHDWGFYWENGFNYSFIDFFLLCSRFCQISLKKSVHFLRLWLFFLELLMCFLERLDLDFLDFFFFLLSSDEELEDDEDEESDELK